MAQVETSQGIHLLIGVVHITELVDEPSIAIDVGVLDGNGLTTLQREDKILGIEHIEYREYAITIHLCHITAYLRNSSEQLLHLNIDIAFHQFLISAQLGSMVTTDALMIVAGLILVERIRCEVQHTIVKTLITQDELVGLCLLLRCLTLRLGHKHLVVQITLIDLPEIEETEHENSTDGIGLLQLAIPVE